MVQDSETIANAKILLKVKNEVADKVFIWSDCKYVSQTQTNCSSSFGYGKNLIAELVVDEFSSNLANLSKQILFTYIDPTIVTYISPPLRGGLFRLLVNHL